MVRVSVSQAIAVTGVSDRDLLHDAQFRVLWYVSRASRVSQGGRGWGDNHRLMSEPGISGVGMGSY